MNERKQLIFDEGLRLFPYRCTAGYITIGVGRNLETNPLSADECMSFLLRRPQIKVNNTELTEIRKLLLSEFYKTGISEDEAFYLLDNDLKRIERDLYRVLPWLKDQPAEVFNILANMAFQMGLNGLLGFTNTLTCIKYKMYPEAAKRMKMSRWAKQTPNRANRLIERMSKL